MHAVERRHDTEGFPPALNPGEWCRDSWIDAQGNDEPIVHLCSPDGGRFTAWGFEYCPEEKCCAYQDDRGLTLYGVIPELAWPMRMKVEEKNQPLLPNGWTVRNGEWVRRGG
jgi:hypothetical protein